MKYRVLRYPALKREKGIDYSREHIRRLERAGRFPKRIQLGDNSVAWIEAEIDAWLADIAALRETEAA